MTVFFTNLLLWPAIFLGLLPLLIHLFARSKPPKYAFSSIEFIRRIVRTTMRVRKPKDWLLLVLRTLLILFLVLAFLRPLFFSQQRLAGHSRRKNVVLIVDSTASMACVDGAQTRFAAACAEAAEVLAGLSSSDSANIVWLDSSPDSVFPEPGSNIGYLRDALRRARVGNEAGTIENALRMAIDMLADAEGQREICILSDFQKSAWEGVPLSVPKGIDLLRIKVGDSTSANGAIADIVCRPASPLEGEQGTIFCEIHNYSPQPRRRTVFLRIGESRQSRSILIPAWGQSTASFEYMFRKSGKIVLLASLDEDSFAGDDQRTEILAVDSALDVAVLGRDDVATEVWMRALNSLDWIEARRIAEVDLMRDGEAYDMIVLSDWNGAGAEDLVKLLEGGAIVFCAPAEGLESRKLGQLIPGVDQAELKGLRLARVSKQLRARIVAERERAFELFSEGEYGDPLEARFDSRLEIPSVLASSGRTLVAYDDGAPALLRFRGSGDFLLWNLPLEPADSNWAGQANFLPFVAEMVLASRLDSRTRQRDALTPGERAVWHLDRDLPEDEIDLEGPEDTSVALESRPRRSGMDFLSEPLDRIGLYTWRHNDRPSEYDAVNFPSIESDLRSMDADELKRDEAVALVSGSELRRLRDGIKLWPGLLALTLCLAMTEFAVIKWAEKT